MTRITLTVRQGQGVTEQHACLRVNEERVRDVLAMVDLALNHRPDPDSSAWIEVLYDQPTRVGPS